MRLQPIKKNKTPSPPSKKRNVSSSSSSSSAESSSSPSSHGSDDGKDVSTTTTPTPASFATILQAHADASRSSSISLTFQKLEQISHKLTNNPSIEHFHRYKQIITTFFKQAIPIAYQLYTTQGSLNPKTMQKKEYFLIKQVNKEIATILQLIQQKERNNLRLLSHTTTIKGLLLDVLQ